MGRACQERGLYYFGLREYDKAIADLSQAIEIAFGLEMYDRYNLNAFRGKAFMGTGRYEEAVNDFTFAISVAPSPEYDYHRWLALRALWRVAEAKVYLSSAGTEKSLIEWY